MIRNRQTIYGPANGKISFFRNFDKEQHKSHFCTVMLITRKLTNDKRPVVDFRLMKTRILRRNTSIPLMSDVLSILGNSECEVVSCVDIKDAFHSIKLTEKSKEYCGILP